MHYMHFYIKIKVSTIVVKTKMSKNVLFNLIFIMKIFFIK